MVCTSLSQCYDLFPVSVLQYQVYSQSARPVNSMWSVARPWTVSSCTVTVPVSSCPVQYQSQFRLRDRYSYGQRSIVPSIQVYSNQSQLYSYQFSSQYDRPCTSSLLDPWTVSSCTDQSPVSFARPVQLSRCLYRVSSVDRPVPAPVVLDQSPVVQYQSTVVQ